MRKLLKHPRAKTTALLAAMSIICVALSFFRVYKTGSIRFVFLNWNLFLAFVPWAITSLVMITPRLRKNKWVLVPVLLSWILFFPNAPYILTDLFHLRLETKVPVWYDLVLILSFAWTGLWYGLMSLSDIEKILAEFIKQRWVTFISITLLFISGFGIYLGRYMRFNSWDIIQEPLPVFAEIADRFIHPGIHPRTWAVTILMGLFLNMIYWSVRLTKKEQNTPE